MKIHLLGPSFRSLVRQGRLLRGLSSDSKPLPSPVTLLSPKDFKKMPWKNGLGTTTELAIGHASLGGAQFAWRISRASVKDDGAFSAFPGVDRILMVLPGSGEGLDLHVGGRTHSMPPLQPVRFSGDDTASATLITGAVEDFNVMTMRGEACADLTVFSADQDVEPVSLGPASDLGSGPWNYSLLYCTQGSANIAVAGEHPVLVQEGHAAAVRWPTKGPQTGTVSGSPSAVCLWVDIGELWRKH